MALTVNKSVSLEIICNHLPILWRSACHFIFTAVVYPWGDGYRLRSSDLTSPTLLVTFVYLFGKESRVVSPKMDC